MVEIRRLTVGDSLCNGLRVLADKLPMARRSYWFLLVRFCLLKYVGIVCVRRNVASSSSWA